MKRGTQAPDPRCWFCHEPIPVYGYYRGYDPTTLDGAYLAVCGPDCAEAPESLTVIGLSRLVPA